MIRIIEYDRNIRGEMGKFCRVIVVTYVINKFADEIRQPSRFDLIHVKTMTLEIQTAAD